MRYCLAVALVWIFATSLPAADEPLTFDIRGPEAPVGMTVRRVSTVKLQGQLTIKREGAGTLDEKVDDSQSKEEEAKVEEVDRRGVARFTTRIVKDETTTTYEGAAVRTAGALVGATVNSKRTGDGWTHTLDDSTPTDEQKTELRRRGEWDGGRKDLPTGLQPIGTTWQVDKKRFEQQFDDMQVKSADIKATFTGVKLFEGQRCAVIEQAGTFKAGIKMQPNVETPATVEVQVTEYRSQANGVLLHSSGTFKLRGSLRDKLDGKALEIDIDFTATLDTRAEVKK